MLLSIPHDLWFCYGLAILSMAGCCVTAWFATYYIKLLMVALHEQRNIMRKSLEIANASNAAKSDFLANTSHEIRTPMNAILGMTHLLLDSPLSPEQQSWAGIVRDSGQSLLNIINDILDLSKIEAGRFNLVMAPVDLCSIFTDVMDLVVHKAEQNNIELLADIAPDVARYVVGDELRLKQILLNLLANAVKFTSIGHVKLTARKVQSNDKAYLQFNVEDTGIGIAEEKLRYIFDKFTQAEESTTRHFGGTGLGLAITYKLVKMMGGDISVTSKSGKGSQFTFTIPLAPADPIPNLIPSVSLSGKRILILADNSATAKIAAAYANNYGLLAETCLYAVDVIECLLAADKRGEPFDFVFIEHSIGSTRTLDLIERIRIYPAFQNIEFLAIATLGSSSASRLLNSNKISALLTRPLLPCHLAEALRIIVNRQQTGAKPELVTRSMIENLRNGSDKKIAGKTFQGSTILVVEDMSVNQLLMKKILQKFGCISDSAMNGKEALALLERNTYDLIFMDGHMPEMDGFETTRRIRKKEAETGGHSIIIALTADAMSGDEEKYINAGMNDYMNKPVMPDRIGAMLSKWLAKA